MSHNAVKCLIGITPAGAVNFFSYGWSCCASDKMIMCNCIQVFQKWFHMVIALVKSQQPMQQFYESQFSHEKKKINSQRIACVQIHVELVIRELKKFKILGSVIPIFIVAALKIMAGQHLLTALTGFVTAKKFF